MNITWFRMKTWALAVALLLTVSLNIPEAEAFRVGRVDISPRLNFEGVYDDNILLRSGGDPDNPVLDEWYGRVDPGVSVSYDHGATTFSSSYNTGFLFHDRLSERNTYARDHRFSLAATHSVSQRTSFTMDDFLLVGTEVADISAEGLVDVERAGILPRQRDFRINRAGVTVSHSLSRRVELSGSGEYGYAWYDAIVQDGVEDASTTEEQNGSVNVSTSFAWRHDNSVSVSGGASYFDYDERGHSMVYVATVGDYWQVTQDLSLNASGGLEYLQETRELGDGAGGSTDDESIHPYGSVSASYALREELSVTGSVSYALSDSSGLGGTVSSRSVRFGLSYSPRSDVAIRTYGLYSKSESAGDGGLELESIQVGAGVRYEVVSWASAYLNYNFIRQQSFGDAAVEGENYEDNRFTMGCTLTLPERIR